MSGLWKGILVASLAINFLFAGFVVGHQFGRNIDREKTGTMGHVAGQGMRGEGMRHRAVLENPMMLARMMVETPILSDEDRKLVRKAYKDHLPDIRRRAQAIEKARLDAFLALMEVPFDRAAYDSATQRLRNLEAEQAQQVWAGIADGLAALPEERRARLQIYLRVKAEEEYARRKNMRQKREQEKRKKLQRQDQPLARPQSEEKEPQE